MIKRIAAILILISVLLGAFSCAPASDAASGSAERRTELRVEIPECIYSQEFADRTANDIIILISDLLWTSKEMKLTESEKASIALYIKETLLPVCKSIPIYPEEIEEMTSIAKKYVNNESIGVNDVCNIYTNASGILGNERNSSLIYEGTKLYLEYELAKAESYFDQLGYPWYEERIDGINEQLDILKGSLGKESFSDIIEIVMLAASALTGAIILDAEGGFITDDEITVILREYSAYISSLDIGEDKWQSAARLLEGFELEALFGESELLSLAIKSMREEGCFEALASSAPSVISLLSSCAISLTKEDIQSLRAGDIPRSLLERDEIRDKFISLDTSLRSALQNDTAILNAISRCGLEEEYASFCDGSSALSAQELLSALADGQAPKDAFASYLASLSPALAFLTVKSEELY